MRLTSTPLIRSFAAVTAMLAFASVHAADDRFVEKATRGGMAEVAAGKLAQIKGSSEAVRQFGSQMVADHTRVGDELKAIVTRKGMTAPTEPDAAHQKVLAKLEGQSGKDFDKAYKAQMVSDHQDTISLFEKQARSGEDAELKAFANKTLPALKHHLEMAKAMK